MRRNPIILCLAVAAVFSLLGGAWWAGQGIVMGERFMVVDKMMVSPQRFTGVSLTTDLSTHRFPWP